MNFNIILKPRLIYDTLFYSFKIELDTNQNISELREHIKSYEIRNVKTEDEAFN